MQTNLKVVPYYCTSPSPLLPNLTKTSASIHGSRERLVKQLDALRVYSSVHAVPTCGRFLLLRLWLTLGYTQHGDQWSMRRFEPFTFSSNPSSNRPIQLWEEVIIEKLYLGTTINRLYQPVQGTSCYILGLNYMLHIEWGVKHSNTNQWDNIVNQLRIPLILPPKQI